MRNLKLASGLPFKVPDIVDITDDLPKKGSWETLKNKQYIVNGAWDGETYFKGFRQPKDITCITIHHSASPEGTLESHANFHAGKWGAGISYHIAIDGGQIKQVNDLLSFTYHASGCNTYTIGIEINADLDKREMTSFERQLLYAAILSVKAVLPITEIKGHREMPKNATACPGKHTDMDRIRKDIHALEAEMEYQDSPNAEMEAAVRVMARLNGMYSNMNNPKYRDESGRKFQFVDRLLDENGFYPK